MDFLEVQPEPELVAAMVVVDEEEVEFDVVVETESAGVEVAVEPQVEPHLKLLRCVGTERLYFQIREDRENEQNP